MPLGEAGSLSCPSCQERLANFQSPSGVLSDCSKCGGQFLQATLLVALLEQREALGTKVPRNLPRHNPLSDSVRYLPCPVCQRTMNRKNFGRTSGVIVDVCAEHGTWFDRGELPRILKFVEAGGLVLARRREAEDKRQKKRRADARDIERALSPLGRPVSVGRPLKRIQHSADAVGAAVDLLDLISRFIR